MTAMDMDSLGGESVLQSKAAIVAPSSSPDADVDYTFIQVFSGVAGTMTYRMK